MEGTATLLLPLAQPTWITVCILGWIQTAGTCFSSSYRHVVTVHPHSSITRPPHGWWHAIITELSNHVNTSRQPEWMNINGFSSLYSPFCSSSICIHFAKLAPIRHCFNGTCDMIFSFFFFFFFFFYQQSSFFFMQKGTWVLPGGVWYYKRFWKCTILVTAHVRCYWNQGKSPFFFRCKGGAGQPSTSLLQTQQQCSAAGFNTGLCGAFKWHCVRQIYMTSQSEQPTQLM